MATLFVFVLFLTFHDNEVGAVARKNSNAPLKAATHSSTKVEKPWLKLLRPRPWRAAEGIPLHGWGQQDPYRGSRNELGVVRPKPGQAAEGIPLHKWGQQDPYSGSENELGLGHMLRSWGNNEEPRAGEKKFEPWGGGMLGDMKASSAKDVLDLSGKATVRAAILALTLIICLVLCIYVPGIVVSRVCNMDSQNFGGIKDRTLFELFWYRWNGWLASPTFTWQILAIFFGTLMCIAVTAILVMKGGSTNLGEATLMAFVFISASSQKLNSGSQECLLGTVCTTVGLFLLAVLLSVSNNYFKSKIQSAQEGSEPVVEGNHVVILGFSNHTPALIEELTLADDKAVLTVLALQEKHMVDQQTKNLKLRKARLSVRSGNWSSAHAMQQVGANGARSIIIPEDPSVSRESSDAQTIAALRTLRGEEWPMNGHVVAQCSLARNEHLMHSIHPGKALILSGDKLGRLLVQSAQDEGLCNIFEQMMGFEGDEFYSCDAGEVGLEGLTFSQLPFRFPEAVPLGILDVSGGCLLNPHKERKIRYGDRILVLAEDADSFSASGEPYFKYEDWKAERPPAEFQEDNPQDFKKCRTLICNFNERGVGRSILFALDSMMGEGSEVDIYTCIPEEECKQMIDSAQEQEGHVFRNIKTKILHVPYPNMASAHELEKLSISSYDHIFILADGPDGNSADRRSVAMILQMQSMASGSARLHFDPVVQVSNKSTVDQLEMCGVVNCIDTNLILSRCLAMVGMNEASYGVLSDLLGAGGNSFDIQDLNDYLAEGETLPIMISFAEATAFVNRASQQVLIGWSSEVSASKRSWNAASTRSWDAPSSVPDATGLLRQWTINPKDKLKSRPWRHNDRVVVIKLVPNAGAEKVTDDVRMLRRTATFNQQQAPSRGSIVFDEDLQQSKWLRRMNTVA